MQWRIVHDKMLQEIPKNLVIVTNIVALVSAGLAVVVTYLGIFPFQNPLGLYRILPGDILVDFIWVWALAGICGVIIHLISPYLASFFIRFHRILTGGAYEYYIEKVIFTPSTSLILTRMQTQRVESAAMLSIWLKNEMQSDTADIREALAPFPET